MIRKLKVRPTGRRVVAMAVLGGPRYSELPPLRVEECF